MDYSFLALQFLSSSMYPKGSLYSASMGWWKVKSKRSQGIWKARRQVTQIHIKEKSKNIWPFAHISMYAGLRSISAYIHEKGIKSHVQQITCVFRDALGNIKGTILVLGVQRVCKGTGKAINVWSTMCGKINCNNDQENLLPLFEREGQQLIRS